MLRKPWEYAYNSYVSLELTFNKIKNKIIFVYSEIPLKWREQKDSLKNSSVIVRLQNT